MVITYYGAGFVRLSFGDMVIAVNPTSKDYPGKTSRFGADIAMSSLNDKAFNGVSEMAYANKEPFVVNGPGEYEFSGVFIKGYESVGVNGKINTIYSFLLENMRVVHLGALADNNLSPDTLEEISGADILIVPTGDEGTLESKAIVKLASSLEPKIIIPTLFGNKTNSELLKNFLNEMGESSSNTVDKLAVKKKDLEGKEGDVVVLSVV